MSTWVEGESFENLRFCVGVICPSILANENLSRFNSLSRKDFELSYLNANGMVSVTEDEKTIPLEGLSILWAPDRKDTMTNVLSDFFKARDSSHAEENRANLKEDTNSDQFMRINSFQVASLIKERKVLLFTGAGVSMTAGLPDLTELNAAIEKIFSPLDSYIDDIVNNRTILRADYVRDYWSLFTESEPTEAHYLVAKLCNDYGYDLATGNFDCLHQKTGLNPIFQNIGDVVIPTLEKYDYILTIGLNSGIGSVSKTFRKKNRQGRIIAISPDPPNYLTDKDFYVNETYSDALSTIINNL